MNISHAVYSSWSLQLWQGCSLMHSLVEGMPLCRVVAKVWVALLGWGITSVSWCGGTWACLSVAAGEWHLLTSCFCLFAIYMYLGKFVVTLIGHCEPVQQVQSLPCFVHDVQWCCCRCLFLLQLQCHVLACVSDCFECSHMKSKWLHKLQCCTSTSLLGNLPN